MHHPRKGIILAGGTGSRLFPLTLSVSKQLLPIYDKPMIYYPLSVLMLADIRDVAIITTPEQLGHFKKLLGTGAQWGMSFDYIAQPAPDGIAQAYILAEDFLDGAPSALVLGDNLFFGHDLPVLLKKAGEKTVGGSVFGYRVNDPERYGVVGFDPDGTVSSIVEKPKFPASNFAITGLYLLDGTAPGRAKTLTASARGELEITALLEMYLNEQTLDVHKMGRGYAWLDTGTHESLLDAGSFVRTLQNRQGLLVGSPDEVAYENGWITRAELQDNIAQYGANPYGKLLAKLL